MNCLTNRCSPRWPALPVQREAAASFILQFAGGCVLVVKRILAMIEFIFPRRLHRLAYFLRGLAFDVVTGILYSCSTTMNAKIWWALVTILTIYGIFFIILPRIRDVGMSGWWILATLVPVADVVLAIILLFRRSANLSDQPDASQATATAPGHPA
jgi:hypothetical protein